ncbi:MAG TPA: hypothetical protein VFM32_09500 [Spongiibacteraceae bacterium]|nr:hypothetical protein [Spongiibacteraceae bacterium]
MTKLLKMIAAAIIAIGAAYFLLIDGIIKSQLEQRGTSAFNTPVSIGNATFHLLPTSLTLHDVHIGDTRAPAHDLIQAEALSLPLSLRDLLAHKLIIDTVDIHGLRFNQPHDQATANNDASNAAASSQLRAALAHVQQMLNHPLASNTLDPNISITGAVLSEQFKPLVDQLSSALTALASPGGNIGDWQVIARVVNVDGTIDVGKTPLRFVGTIENVTPQPQLFDVATQFELHNAENEAAILHATGSLDKRKLTQASLRLDLDNFALVQWPLSTDPELNVVIRNATVDIQAVLSLTGNQFDLNALSHFRNVHADIASSDNAVASTIADVWRRTDAFDLNLQASGDVTNPVLKLNSSLDVPLARALQQLQPSSAFPGVMPNSP